MFTFPRFRRRAALFTPKYIVAEAHAPVPADVLEAVRLAHVVASAPPVDNIPAPSAEEVYRSGLIFTTRVQSSLYVLPRYLFSRLSVLAAFAACKFPFFWP